MPAKLASEAVPVNAKHPAGAAPVLALAGTITTICDGAYS